MREQSQTADASEDPTSAPRPSPPAGSVESGKRIDQYEVGRLLGEGGMGAVYLARDTVLGRSVALKVIPARRLGADEVRALLQEARTTARFNHPNIVVVYGVGECDVGPYLALEYVPGETLRQRVQGRRLAVPEAQRVMLEVARGVAEAHRHGVFHRDLKPSNIIVTDEGRVRILDFGLAAHTGQARSRSGTPQYMAPEQWREERQTTAVDVWAIGVMLHELVAGRRPFDDARGLSGEGTELARLSADVPLALAGLVSRCLAPSPAMRPAIDEVVAELTRLVDGARMPAIDESPFRGLEPFGERHAATFHGRGDEVAALVERLRGESFVPVVGATGAGKSSLVQAGLVPRLREQGAWIVLTVRPGSTPFRSLAVPMLASVSSESVDIDELDALARSLEETPGELNVRLHALARRSQSRVLLFVDQLEELYTHGTEVGTRTRFAEALVAGAASPDGPVRVVLTVRDDFLGRLAEAPSMQRALSRVFVLRPPRRMALRASLVEPVRAAGYHWEDEAIVDAMIDAVEGTVGYLPLLQFTCAAMWSRRDVERKCLRRADYVEIGGVTGALAEHAESTLSALSLEERLAARTMLTRLVTVEGTRRVVAQARAVADTGVHGGKVLSHLLDSRLLTSRFQPDGASTLELAHESLVRGWPQLAAWLEDSRDERALITELTEAADLWERRGRRTVDLMSGETVGDARRRLAALTVTPSPFFSAFLEASDAYARGRARRRRGLFVGAIATLLVVTGGSLLAAATFREQARQINLAAADMGHIELYVAPYGPDASDVSATLTWAFHRVEPSDDLRPGAAIPKGQMNTAALPPLPELPAGRGEAIEIRSGPAFLVVAGRGGRDRTCPPSVLRLRSLPGYAEREAGPRRFVIEVPTCAESLAGAVPVPAGELVRGGIGVPPLKHGTITEAETIVHVDAFQIERTETTRRRFAPFARLKPFLATPLSAAAEAPLLDASALELPVVGVEHRTAHDFCAFHGGRLPTSVEWEKAARGGLMLAPGVPNPEPRRNFPWVLPVSGPTANLAGATDGYEGIAPVGRFPAGQSPYGILDLAGNVDEWTASRPDLEGAGYLRVVHGGAWRWEAELELHSVQYENKRVERYADDALGFRCVIE